MPPGTISRSSRGLVLNAASHTLLGTWRLATMPPCSEIRRISNSSAARPNISSRPKHIQQFEALKQDHAKSYRLDRIGDRAAPLAGVTAVDLDAECTGWARQDSTPQDLTRPDGLAETLQTRSALIPR